MVSCQIWRPGNDLDTDLAYNFQICHPTEVVQKMVSGFPFLRKESLLVWSFSNS
jgi:hypothetical protein